MTTRLLFPKDPGRVAVKICGITTGDQAREIITAGADAIGINFWPKSKRYIALEAALPWLLEIAGTVPRVAVTVNASDEELLCLYESGGIDWIQLHGDETPERVRSLTQQGLPVFKAMGIRDRAMLAGAAEFDSPTLLLDAYAPNEYGGSGETMDWSLGAAAVQQWPDRQILLAGGLTPANVAEAIRQVHPAGVDVASGVESSPGVKDLEAVRCFIEAVRTAS
ncbi:MAG: phosphoribosylanthranilate isomerase [Verrucomicrobiales bacterium]|nr:phosphoribosylanthranilate isomerase [Verrucomicrobiales bacterium]MBP6603602.1 phosphoribosylanthranilate isomerase [Verrucomicrobiales bacterium]MBP9224530.1 phosphoribosylanthranilate isomerase [Verrucomicrobiales bacterium]